MKVTVWNENVHEKHDPRVTEIYPGGIHTFLANILKDDDIEVRTATLDDEECGLTEEVLADTDVLVWWSHCAHHKVPDEIVRRVQKKISGGMGFIALHSTHFAKIFKKIMGTECTLKWRETDNKERIWTILPNHPIAQGVPETFALEGEEMYGEPFDIPTPDEIVFLGWFDGGEVFRSGCTWRRGNANIFYFQPGHEVNRAFHNEHVQRILKNAVRWACPINKNIRIECPEFAPLENQGK